MPTDHDVKLLQEFLGEVLATLTLVIERGDIRSREREALNAACREFAELQPPLIVAAYRATDDKTLVAAGVIGKQLWAKIDVPNAAAEDIRRELDERGRTGTYGVRRWIGRVKVLVGTLKGILPAAEALTELLDLLNVALDRRRSGS